MKAIVVDRPGGPDAMRIGEVPEPAPRPGEILVEVAATAVNRADLLQRMGLYPPPPGASPILGLECSGQVLGHALDVAGWRPGDRVCALLSGGGYAERVAVPAGQAMPVPAGLELDEAAAIPEAFLTAWDNLVTRGRLAPGETVLIHGGAGGVGTAAIQLVRRLGARALVTAGSTAKLERCMALGADAGIDHRTEDFVERVDQLTGGTGVDLVLDVMGAAYLQRNLEVLAPEGRLVVIGLQGGMRANLDLELMMRRRLTLQGTTLRSRPIEAKAAIVRDFVEGAWDGFSDGSLSPVVDRRLPLAQAAEAHRLMEASEHVGKIVLTVSS